MPVRDLIEMPPIASNLDVRNGGLAYAVGRGDIFVPPYIYTDGSHLIAGELMCSRTFSPDSRLSALRHFVIHVVLMRTQEEMVWIDATGNVAFVQHVNAVRDLPAVRFPCKSMGELIGAIPFHPTVAVRIGINEPKLAPAHRLRHGVVVQSLLKREVTGRNFSRRFRHIGWSCPRGSIGLSRRGVGSARRLPNYTAGDAWRNAGP